MRLENTIADLPEKSWPTRGHNRGPALPDEGKNLPLDRISLQDVARERFADLICDVWPAPSKAETARQCAACLGVSERTAKNWLACTHSAPFDVVFAIGCMVGIGRVMDVLTRGQGRLQVLNLIVRGVRYVASR